MIDRAIGIIGVALTLITAVLQYYWPHLPSWAPWVGVGMGIFLLGLSIGLVVAGGSQYRRKTLKGASLKLHMFGDHRTPERIAADNIFRWFYLQTAIHGVSPSGVTRIGTLSTLFVAFDSDVVVSTIRVRSPDMQLPIHEVKEFNQRYAIVTFSDNVPAGTLEVVVTP
jgi:hypothetical protein